MEKKEELARVVAILRKDCQPDERDVELDISGRTGDILLCLRELMHKVAREVIGWPVPVLASVLCVGFQHEEENMEGVTIDMGTIERAVENMNREDTTDPESNSDVGG